MRVIILSDEDFIYLYGKGNNGSELRPTPYQDKWVLPIAVLSDKDYESEWEHLSALPQEDVEVLNDEA